MGHDAWLHASGPREQREAWCGWRLEVEGRTEYRLWLPEREERDVICEECGAEGEL